MLSCELKCQMYWKMDRMVNCHKMAELIQRKMETNKLQVFMHMTIIISITIINPANLFSCVIISHFCKWISDFCTVSSVLLVSIVLLGEWATTQHFSERQIDQPALNWMGSKNVSFLYMKHTNIVIVIFACFDMEMNYFSKTGKA